MKKDTFLFLFPRFSSITLLLILLLALQVIPVNASPTEEQDIFKKTDQDTDKTQNDSRNKKNYLFSINPGLIVSDSTLNINNSGYGGTLNPGAAVVSFSFDIKSSDIEFSEKSGVNFIFHSTPYVMKKQIFHYPGTKTDGDSSSSSSESSSNDNNTESSGQSKSVDVGTRVRGYYSYLVPAFYTKPIENLRIGIGIGTGFASAKGTFQGESSTPMMLYGNYFIFESASVEEKKEYLDLMSFYYFSGGMIEPGKSDPVITYLVLNLSKGRNLEYLGRYAYFNGYIKQIPLIYMLGAISGNGNLSSFMEIMGLMAISRGIVDINNTPLMTGLLFLEYQFPNNFSLNLIFGEAYSFKKAPKLKFTNYELSLAYNIKI